MRFHETKNTPIPMICDSKEGVDYILMYDLVPVLNKLQAKIEFLSGRLEYYDNEQTKDCFEIENLKAKIKIYEGCRAFYADVENWNPRLEIKKDDYEPVFPSQPYVGGKRAREAGEKIKAIDRGEK